MRSTTPFAILLVVLILPTSLYIAARRLRPAGNRNLASVEVSDYERLRDEQTARLAQWAAADPTPLTARAIWSEAITVSPTTGCLTPPAGVTPLAADSIGTRPLASFNQTLVDLVIAYADDGDFALFDFMAARAESPGAEDLSAVTDLLRDILQRKDRRAATGLTAKSPRDIYATFKREGTFKSHWHSILCGSICRQFWKVGRIPEETLKGDPPIDEKRLFMNLTLETHRFNPKTSQRSVLERDGGMVFGDAKVVILLDPSSYSEPLPYYFRFWYDPEADVWHPFQMGWVATGGSSQDARVLF